MISRRMMVAGAIACACMSACGDDDPLPFQPPVHGPVEIQADVNVALGDTPAGTRPPYTVTSFLTATQDSVRIAAHLDSIVLSYRLNSAPFVRIRALFQTPYSDVLPVTVQPGDQYTLLARIFASSTGAGGRSASVASDWIVSARAVTP